MNLRATEHGLGKGEAFRLGSPWLAILSVTGLFVLSLVAFFVLSRLSDAEAEAELRRDLTDSGAGMIGFLSLQSAISGTNMSAEVLRLLPSQLDTLKMISPRLGYVRVSEGGVEVCRHVLADSTFRPLPEGVMIMTNTLCTSGAAETGYLSFCGRVRSHDGALVDIEVGLVDTAPARSGGAARRSRVTLIGVAMLIFYAAVTIGIIIWHTFGSRRRLARQRQEEHIIFSGMLANSIVHDFRNPMSSVKLDAQMLLREVRRAGGGDRDRLAVLSERISKTLGRMDDIFREFLFLSRPADVTKENFDLRSCIDDCVEMFTARFEHRRLRCKVAAPLGDMTAYASESAVRRALMNVLTNAIWHSPEGGQIDIVAEKCDRFWQLEVCDRGEGIPPNLREKVFRIFFTTRSSGTGLGLFMARAALTNCGGSICALGRSGGGCVIRMMIPAQQNVPTSKGRG